MADGIARSGWDIDLLEGKAREGAFAHVLCQARIEVKSDRRCRETGNLFIEFRQRSKRDGRWYSSGIATTEAAWWAFEVDDDVWVTVPTWRLKAVARRLARERPGSRRYGGDYNGYEGVLVPLSLLLRSDGYDDDASAWPSRPRDDSGAEEDW